MPSRLQMILLMQEQLVSQCYV